MAKVFFTTLLLGVLIALTFAQYRHINGYLIPITASPTYVWGNIPKSSSALVLAKAGGRGLAAVSCRSILNTTKSGY